MGLDPFQRGQHDTAFVNHLIVCVICGDADEVPNREACLVDVVDLTCPTPPHLLIEDRGFCEARHHKVRHFRAIKARVEHIHGHKDFRKRFVLEALDLGFSVAAVVLRQLRHNKIRVSCFGRGFLIRKGLVK